MKQILVAALVGASVASVTLPCAAAAQPADADPCFLTRDLRGHTVGDNHTLFFDVNGRWIYRVTTGNNCLTDVTRSDPIVLRDRGLGKICHPLDMELIVRGNHCAISELTRLTPAEASALPKRLQP